MTVITDYSLNVLKDEVRHLLDKGLVDRHQSICVLCEFIPPREWVCVECELERNDYTLRDRICDLLCKDEWKED